MKLEHRILRETDSLHTLETQACEPPSCALLFLPLRSQCPLSRNLYQNIHLFLSGSPQSREHTSGLDLKGPAISQSILF